MFKTKAKSKFIDISKSFKIYYVLGIGIFVCFLSFLIYRNFIVTFTLGVCTVILYVLLSRPSTDLLIEIDDEAITIDKEKIPWEKCIFWAVVDLGDVWEIVIQTSGFAKDFYYLYLEEDSSQTKLLMSNLSQYLPYSEQAPQINRVHRILRNWGLK